MLSAVVLLVCTAFCSAYPRSSVHLNETRVDDERIIGGVEVVKNRYPFMVRIQGTSADGQGFLCGASLLHESYVVTAAHCVFSQRMPIVALTLHFGDHHVFDKESTQYSMDIPMAYVRYHPEYNENGLTNDIALIRLPSSVPISQHVRPICVAIPERESGFSYGTAIGWGQMSNNGGTSEVLREINLPVLHHDECRQFGTFFNPKIMMCAGNSRGIHEAICFGDSGGPFVANPSNPILIGLSSFVSRTGCVAVGFPVVFTRVSTYIPWLRGFMGSALCTI